MSDAKVVGQVLHKNRCELVVQIESTDSLRRNKVRESMIMLPTLS